MRRNCDNSCMCCQQYSYILPVLENSPVWAGKIQTEAPLCFMKQSHSLWLGLFFSVWADTFSCAWCILTAKIYSLEQFRSWLFFPVSVSIVANLLNLESCYPLAHAWFLLLLKGVKCVKRIQKFWRAILETTALKCWAFNCTVAFLFWPVKSFCSITPACILKYQAQIIVC